MKLLVVGQSYVAAFLQGKYVAMKRLDAQLQLRLVVPHEVKHVFMTYRPEIHPELEAQDVVALPARLNQSHMTRFLHPMRLSKLLKTFNPDHIHIEEDPHSFSGVETVFLARRICPRATLSFFVWDNLAREPYFPLNIIKKVLTRYSLNRCSMVICGNTEGQDLLKKVKGYHGPSQVLPQVGLDPDEYTEPLPAGLPAELGKTDDTPLVGFLGRMVPEKGVLLLLEALFRLRALPWKLLLVGNGPLRNEILTRWQNAFGERLIAREAIPHRVVSQYLRCLDIFVLPSYGIPKWKEQFGLTLAQAMMAGVACIGSSSGAIPEVMGPGGLVFKENDVDSLTEVLKKMLESKDLRKELGEKGQTFALQRYTNTAVATLYLEAFKNIMAKKSI
jgi:glycosyltransferase involved in cell wall biosynthesis